MFVSDEGAGWGDNPRIMKYAPDGTASTFVTSGLGDPVGLAVDAGDNL
ncbi:MAG: hypothetical protein ACE15C_21590 [Phycisphaerae bacterium]